MKISTICFLLLLLYISCAISVPIDTTTAKTLKLQPVRQLKNHPLEKVIETTTSDSIKQSTTNGLTEDLHTTSNIEEDTTLPPIDIVNNISPQCLASLVCSGG